MLTDEQIAELRNKWKWEIEKVPYRDQLTKRDYATVGLQLIDDIDKLKRRNAELEADVERLNPKTLDKRFMYQCLECGCYMDYHAVLCRNCTKALEER